MRTPDCLHWLALTILAGGAVGCQQEVLPDDPDQETGFPYAAYHASCSPVDGHAEVLALTHQEVEEAYGWTGPRLTVDVYRPPFLGEPGMHQSEGATDDDGAAVRCDSEDQCEVADRFTLRVDSVLPDGRVEGFLRAEFTGGEVIAGPFSAGRIDFSPLCG
ncbi:MAG: hypothetical protein HKN73_03090 [Gemmatimonadetes bacterium]|nr:hypothetical protein [Gemmatimonadota bacterium]